MLAGGSDNDCLIGDTGNNHFVFNTQSDGLNQIVDFNIGDVLDFQHGSGMAFGNDLAVGAPIPERSPRPTLSLERLKARSVLQELASGTTPALQLSITTPTATPVAVLFNWLSWRTESSVNNG
jgi:hypothetical protein